MPRRQARTGGSSSRDPATARMIARVGCGASLLALTLVTACLGPTGSASGERTQVTYLPSLSADVRLPTGQLQGSRTTDSPAKSSQAKSSEPTATPPSPTPVVVLVPGGGWLTADYAGLLPLADALATSGMVAISVSYRGADDGGRFPQMVAQVVCAVDFAADQVRRAGLTPWPVVVLGHSSGAHLAALATLAADHFRAGCPYPPVVADAFVGLAGAYDVDRLREVARPLFGVDEAAAPQLWREGTPATWGAARANGPTLRVLLVHGTVDTLVPPTMTTTFGHQLSEAGQPVTVLLLPGADHATIYTPKAVASPVAEWIRAPALVPEEAGRTALGEGGGALAEVAGGE